MFSRVFKAFHYRDFRLMWIGACTSSIGTWMQVLAQSWLVYKLTNNAFYLGLDSFLGQIPIVLFSLVGGVFADRTDRRKLLLMSQFVQMTCAFALTVMIAFGLNSIWPILCISFIVGTAQSFGGPAYSALVPTLVDSEDLPNAIALNAIQFNLARVIGPVIGGIAMEKLGAAWCFGLNGLSFIAVIITLFMVKMRFVPSKTKESVLESMKSGVRFIVQKEAMVSLMALAFSMTLVAFPMLAFMPVFARDVLHGSPGQLSALLASSGGGAIAGSIMVAAFGKKKGLGKFALIMLLLLGIFMTAFALSRTLIMSCVFLFFAGAAMMGVFAMVTSLVQLITADDMRGRVMSVFNVAFRGGMPIGSIIMGAIIARSSAPPVIAVNGVLLVLLGLFYLFVHRRVAKL